MRIDIDKTVENLRSAEDVLILTHKNPDGDTLGCATALCRALHSMGKRAKILNNDKIPSKYDFLFEGIEKQDFEPSYIVAVDVADSFLLGDNILNLYGDKVDLCIDHHGSNKEFAKELYLEADDGAASLTILKILKKMGVKITKEIADDLYTGLSTDTGCFKYSNAGVEEYEAGAELIKYGADNAKINVLMFETKPMAYFDLLSLVLSGMRKYCDGKVIVFKVTNEMFEKTGATPDQCDAIAALSRQVEGALCGITMKEKPAGGFKFSLRTHEPLDAAALCGAFGGGGHMRAAGCDAPDDGESVLAEMIKLIEKEL